LLDVDGHTPSDDDGLVLARFQGAGLVGAFFTLPLIELDV